MYGCAAPRIEELTKKKKTKKALIVEWCESSREPLHDRVVGRADTSHC
jgi:hypothetical protein